MKLIISIIFIIIYIIQIKYYFENKLSKTCPVVSACMLILNVIGVLAIENKISSIVGTHFFAIFAIWLSYIPIYKHYRDFKSTKNIINHIIDIISRKNAICRRSDYILFILTMLVLWMLILIIMFFTNNLTNTYGQQIFGVFFIGICILNLIFQSKRLQDANLSKWFLLIYLISIFGNSFAFVAFLVMFALLMFPSSDDSILTTKIHISDEEK